MHSMMNSIETYLPFFENKRIKGIIVGYPLDHNNQETPICRHIENFISYMIDHRIVRRPVTFVNEYRTTREAAIKILKQQQSNPDEFFIQSLADSVKMKNHPIAEFNRTELMYKKTVYDKLAAQSILERFLEMYNAVEVTRDKHEIPDQMKPDDSKAESQKE